MKFYYTFGESRTSTSTVKTTVDASEAGSSSPFESPESDKGLSAPRTFFTDSKLLLKGKYQPLDRCNAHLLDLLKNYIAVKKVLV